MPLTTADLVWHIGSQAMIENARVERIWGGDIRNIYVKSGQLTIQFQWMVRGETHGRRVLPTQWTIVSPQDYKAYLGAATLAEDTPERMVIEEPTAGHILTLSRVDTERLDPSKIKGFHEGMLGGKMSWYEFILTNLRALCEDPAHAGASIRVMAFLDVLAHAEDLPAWYSLIMKEQLEGYAEIVSRQHTSLARMIRGTAEAL